jgi:hypothetical protein
MPRIWPAMMIDAVKRGLPRRPAVVLPPFDHIAQQVAHDRRHLEHRRRFQQRGRRSPGALFRSSSWLTTACVVARLPAVIIVMIRSPGTCQLNILRNTEMLSTPELVRCRSSSRGPVEHHPHAIGHRSPVYAKREPAAPSPVLPVYRVIAQQGQSPSTSAADES